METCLIAYCFNTNVYVSLNEDRRVKNTLFLVGVGPACAQDGPHDHSDDGEHTNRDNHHDHQNMILLAARDAWFI